jgi:hypothetical protein
VSTLFAIMRSLGTECTEEFTKIHSKSAWRVGSQPHTPHAPPAATSLVV